MILDKACMKESCNILLPCCFTAVYMGCYYSLCMVYQQNIFFVESSQINIYFFCFGLKVVVSRCYIDTLTCLSLLKVIAISIIDFAINSSERSDSKSFLPTCSTKNGLGFV